MVAVQLYILPFSMPTTIYCCARLESKKAVVATVGAAVVAVGVAAFVAAVVVVEVVVVVVAGLLHRA